MGIIFKNDGEFFVFEAMQPVKMTPVQKWLARGKNGEFVVKRLKNTAVLTETVISHMKEIGKQYAGKDYDLLFAWSDERMYCSELVWKLYKQAAGVEIGHLKKLKDFNLSDAAVQKKLAERYKSQIPLEETVISPADMFDSVILETVDK